MLGVVIGSAITIGMFAVGVTIALASGNTTGLRGPTGMDVIDTVAEPVSRPLTHPSKASTPAHRAWAPARWARRNAPRAQPTNH